ncbi:hypothetical protein ECANGB1_1550 [Enterospora canceri]|uniref:Chromatin modification-related protein EAF6 n=1 Tax=Enterospora canceri TaxID=1081671 RepID=A0A1Y1S5T7_9MICR|nr:hypothetical protein ECANGB1_1550 [Enterospora canceri]
MGKRKNKEEIKKLLELNSRIQQLNRDAAALDSEIFKNETAYLTMTKGMPITQDCEYYINGKIDRKTEEISNKTRIFNTSYPGCNDI